jgi:membrane associated rhomboid family serine protease/Zn-finger nucleic acid-binding protein
MICPRCRIRIRPKTSRAHRVPIWSCQKCTGKVIHGPHRILFFSNAISLWIQREVQKAKAQSSLQCPNCNRGMRKVILDEYAHPLEMDGCLHCSTLWFDPGEIERLKDHAIHAAPTPVSGYQMIEHEITRGPEFLHLASKRRNAVETGLIQDTVLSLLQDSVSKDRFSSVMAGLFVLMIWVSVFGFKNPHAAYTYFALGNSFELGVRSHALPWLSSFLMLPNGISFFFQFLLLWTFGRDLELMLGRTRFILLILGSQLVGSYFVNAFAATESKLYFGPSAVNAGLMSYSILKYPQKQFLAASRHLGQSFPIPQWVFAIAFIAIHATDRDETLRRSLPWLYLYLENTSFAQILGGVLAGVLLSFAL